MFACLVDIRMHTLSALSGNPKINEGLLFNNADLIRRMMAWKPEDRCSARDALQHPFFTADIANL